jgi:hypothetical protein
MVILADEDLCVLRTYKSIAVIRDTASSLGVMVPEREPRAGREHSPDKPVEDGSDAEG